MRSLPTPRSFQIAAESYFITQNPAGTVYTLYSSIGQYVQYVASNSTPDIVPLLNIAIAGLYANNGGIIQIGPGQFLAANPAVASWSQDPNASGSYYVIGLPITNNFIPITIRGAGAGAMGAIYPNLINQALPSSGTQILFGKNSSTVPTGTNYFIYSLASPGQVANYVQVHLDSIRFTQNQNNWLNSSAVSQSLVMIGLGTASQLTSVGGLIADTYTSNTEVIVQPGAGNYAIQMPANNNQGCNHMDWVQISGYYWGITVFDHAEIGSLYIQACYIAIFIDCGHSGIIGNLNIQQCSTWFWMTANNCHLNINTLDTESPTNLTGSNAWQNFTNVFQDEFTYPIAGLWGWNTDDAFASGSPTVWSKITSQLPAGNYLWSFQGAATNIGGTTAGNAACQLSTIKSGAKEYVVILTGYENTSGTSQTYTFPVPFNTSPKIINDDTGGASVSTTTLTLPHSMGSAVTGTIILQGY